MGKGIQFFRLLLVGLLMMISVLFVLVGERLIHVTGRGMVGPFILLAVFGVVLFVGIYFLFQRDNTSK